MHEYDKSSKWLIQHHGDSILRLAGVRDIIAWRPLQAELVPSRSSCGRSPPSIFWRRAILA
ncbi:MAG: hypothetical protein ACLQIB_42660 [Isosphaeraceae bacterium]